VEGNDKKNGDQTDLRSVVNQLRLPPGHDGLDGGVDCLNIIYWYHDSQH
jgi:hypothetical protein